MNIKKRKNESGYILISSIILMLAVTLLAVASMRSADVEEVMARGHRDISLAQQAAETKIKEAEASIDPALPINATECRTFDSEIWSDEQTGSNSLVERIDPCDGSSSLSMGGSTTQKTDQKYRIIATDFDDPNRLGSQVTIETIFIP